MKKTSILFVVGFIMLSITLTTLILGREPDNTSVLEQQAPSITAENCLSDSCLAVEELEFPVSELPDTVIEALNYAIDDEYKARATYATVIQEFGNVRPFSMIIRAEEQHIALLKSVYDKYDLTIPKDPYASVTIASSLTENCSIGVQAEIDNAALYRNTLLPAVADYPDMTSLFTKLMNDSQDKHLPAFERCAI